MRNSTTFLIGVLLVTCYATVAMARDKYPPGPPYRTCPDTLHIFDIQQTDTLLAPCHPATADTVWGVRGIITGFDTKTPGLGFYIQNTFANGGHARTGLDVFTGSFNYQSSVPTSPSGGNLALGDSVVIYGTTQEFPASNGETEIEGPDVNQSTDDILIQKINSGNPLPAFHVGTTHDFNWVPSSPGNQGEEWEGCLVRINGPLKSARTATGLGVAGNTWLIVDPSSPADSVLIDGFTLTTFGAPAVGTTIDFVQGILNQRNSTTGTGAVNSYRIQIRGGSDISVQTPPTLNDAYPIEDNILRLVYDRNVDPTTAQNAAKYTLGSQLDGSTVDAAVMEAIPGNVVRLTITSVRTDGELETVNVLGVGSATCPACLISPAQTRTFINGVLSVATIQAPDPAFLPLFDDRSRFAGTGTVPGERLTVRAIATESFGALYYLQDLAGGPRSGISVFAPITPLISGRRYLVAGAVQEFSNETEVVGSVYVVDEGAGPTPPPFDIGPVLQTVGVLSDTTTDQAQNFLNGEDFEGMLVRVQGVKVVNFNTPPEDPAPGGSFRVVQPNPTYGDTILISDIGLDKYTFDADQDMYLNVNGVMHYTSSFRILPRKDADIEFLGNVGVDGSVPRTLSLSVSPNPARSARITFTLPQRSEVNLAVFDLQGRQVAQIAKGVFDAGKYTRSWDATDRSGNTMGAGMYFYRLKVGDKILNARGVITH